MIRNRLPLGIERMWIGVVLFFMLSAFSSIIPAASPSTLKPFADEEELNQWIKAQQAIVEAQLRKNEKARASGSHIGTPEAKMMASEAAPAMMEQATSEAEESVTNTQTAGVDEGGIIKVVGNYLVILRRGRLFTIDINQNRLQPVSYADAYGPHPYPGGTWYDEMLVHKNTVIVIGYSYKRGGTEIGLFDLDKQGKLTFRDTYILRSNDYYSSRNYASRLIGDTLIFYTSLHLSFYPGHPPLTAFPALGRVQGNRVTEFKRIAPATQIYRTDEEPDPYHGIALHTVQRCDLSKREMTCDATAVLGHWGREFYVSKDSVYLWTTGSRRQASSRGPSIPVSASLFRLPLDGTAPTGIKTQGAPIDQFSFHAANNGTLNVLLRAEGRNGMWSSERGTEKLALFRIALSALGDGTQTAPDSSYTPLPVPTLQTLQNRFIGPYLLYGTGQTWYRVQASVQPVEKTLFVVPWNIPNPTAQPIVLHHSVDRIEALGSDAIAIGQDGEDLLFSSIQLTGTSAVRGKPASPSRIPRKVSEYRFQKAAQGETRSHGFFYRSDSPGKGLLGLPVRSGGGSGWRQLKEASSSVVFLENNQLQLQPVGKLTATAYQDQKAFNDGCVASCVDWYGNSRPVFLRGRIFALMGYEIVEGTLSPSYPVYARRYNKEGQLEEIVEQRAGSLQEIRRINYAPQVPVGKR